MRLRHDYLVLCFLGFLLPYFHFVPWLLTHGFDLPRFLNELFANRISAFFGLDVFVSAIVLCVFVCSEGRQLGARAVWLPILALVTVGVSLGLPLFLYLRQIQLEQSPRHPRRGGN